MAVVRDNNKWNADLLTDLTSIGSDDGVTADVVAWAVDQNNWYYPNSIGAASSTWTAQATGAGVADLQEAYVGGNTIVTDATNGNFDVSGSEAISLDASMASNFTVTGAALTLSTVTSGDVTLTPAGSLVLDYSTWPAADGTSGYVLSTNGSGVLSWIAASGGASAWSAVLAVGATSGGTNPILTDADVFQGADTTGTNAGAMAIRGGDVTSGAGDGGAVTIDGGDAGAGDGNGGSLNITGGNAVGNENTGAAVTITGGGATDGGGGEVTAQGGPGTGTGRSGGNLILRGGTAGTNATGGQVQINGRLGNGTGTGGVVTIAGGQGGVTGAGANVTISGGDGGATSGNAGNILLVPGTVTSGTVGLVAVDSSLTLSDVMFRLDRSGGTAGSISDFFVGQSTPSFTAKAGSLYLKNDGTSATGGAVYVQQDASGGGDDGSTWLELGSGGGGGSAWSEETNTTTDATSGVTIATPISPLTDGDQQSVEVLVTAESGGANTYFRRQVFTFYRDGAGAVQWTTEVNGTEALRGFGGGVTASLSVSGNDVLVTATGQAATTINWTVQYRTTNTITSGGTVSTTGIVRETFDNRGAATTTGSASGSGGTADFTLAAGAAYVTMQYLRVKNASGTCADATIQFFRDASRTDEIYDAQNKDTSTTNGWVDRNPSTMMGDDGSGLSSNLMYGRITNNDAGAATFDVEAILWGVV